VNVQIGLIIRGRKEPNVGSWIIAFLQIFAKATDDQNGGIGKTYSVAWHINSRLSKQSCIRSLLESGALFGRTNHRCEMANLVSSGFRRAPQVHSAELVCIHRPKEQRRCFDEKVLVDV
jgi:hypothetical protein